MFHKELKVFLFGDYRNNNGPENVNRNLIKNCNQSFFYEKSKNKIFNKLERLFYLIKCDVIVYSGIKNKFWLAIAKIFNKKTIYLMHGCICYENKINKLQISEKIINYEKEFLKSVDLVLTVSEQYKYWVSNYFSNLKINIHFLNLGIEKADNHIINKKLTENSKISIIVAGGDRIQKNNIEVCKAVEILSKKLKKEIEIKICGEKNFQENIFENYVHSISMGMLSQKEFYEELKKSSLFIVNSEVESFGLAAIDALLCDCSVLISENSGIRSILDLKDEEIIYDVHNSCEIAKKIEFVLNNKNSTRILSKIDFEHYSWKKVADRLYRICNALYQGNDYKKIK